MKGAKNILCAWCPLSQMEGKQAKGCRITEKARDRIAAIIAATATMSEDASAG